VKFKKLFLIITFLLILLVPSKLNGAEIPYVDEDLLNYKYEITNNTAQWSTRLRLVTTDYGNINFIYYQMYKIDEYTLDTKQRDKKIIMYNYKF
jgi:hypothetical protein